MCVRSGNGGKAKLCLCSVEVRGFFGDWGAGLNKEGCFGHFLKRKLSVCVCEKKRVYICVKRTDQKNHARFQNIPHWL